MATAFEKFIRAMNRTSPYWTKAIEVVAQEGKITVIKHEGFTFKSDPKENGEGKEHAAEKGIHDGQ